VSGRELESGSAPISGPLYFLATEPGGKRGVSQLAMTRPATCVMASPDPPFDSGGSGR